MRRFDRIIEAVGMLATVLAVVLAFSSLSGCAFAGEAAKETFWLKCGLTQEPQECLP